MWRKGEGAAGMGQGERSCPESNPAPAPAAPIWRGSPAMSRFVSGVLVSGVSHDQAAAVEDYMRLHPDADEAAVRAEVAAVAAAGW